MEYVLPIDLPDLRTYSRRTHPTLCGSAPMIRAHESMSDAAGRLATIMAAFIMLWAMGSRDVLHRSLRSGTAQWRPVAGVDDTRLDGRPRVNRPMIDVRSCSISPFTAGGVSAGGANGAAGGVSAGGAERMLAPERWLSVELVDADRPMPPGVGGSCSGTAARTCGANARDG